MDSSKVGLLTILEGWLCPLRDSFACRKRMTEWCWASSLGVVGPRWGGMSLTAAEKASVLHPKAKFLPQQLNMGVWKSHQCTLGYPWLWKQKVGVTYFSKLKWRPLLSTYGRMWRSQSHVSGKSVRASLSSEMLLGGAAAVEACPDERISMRPSPKRVLMKAPPRPAAIRYAVRMEYPERPEVAGLIYCWLTGLTELLG